MMIKSAAIIHEDIIYDGYSHAEIGHKMLLDKVCKRPFPGGKAQGFVTECGQFVSRIHAMTIAIEAGQVVKGETCNKRDLFSEDLH
jgi:hypothetical protein